jgi:RES domain-containing protein
VPLAWRITANRFAATAFDGEGARLLGGRWNSPGISLLYTSESPALAALELLVGLNDPASLSGFSLLSIDVPEAVITELDRANLPADWRSFPAPPQLALLGDAWIRAGTSVALRVPSVVIDPGWNLLVNPRHPQFAQLERGAPIPFPLDRRLRR